MSWAKYFEILGALLLAFPFIWEVTNDKDGDAHVSRARIFKVYQVASKRVDILARVLITICAASFNHFINDIHFFKSCFLAAGIHFFFFDYTIAYVLIRRQIIVTRAHWFTYLGSKGLDNFHYWKTMDPVSRLVVRALVFALSLAIYFH